MFCWLLKLVSQLLQLHNWMTWMDGRGSWGILHATAFFYIDIIDIHCWANCTKTFIVRSEKSVFDLILPLISERQFMALCLSCSHTRVGANEMKIWKYTDKGKMGKGGLRMKMWKKVYVMNLCGFFQSDILIKVILSDDHGDWVKEALD